MSNQEHQGRPFDHGEMNIPLRKRQGNIDAQLIRYHEEQRQAANRADKTRRAEWRQKVAKVEVLIKAMSIERLAELGRPHKLTPDQTRKMLLSAARSDPERALRAMSKEVA